MLVQCVFGTCGLFFWTNADYNYTSISQANGVYIKRDSRKEIWSKLFFTHNQPKNGDIDIERFLSSDNLADLFMKVVSSTTFEKFVKSIRVQRLKDLN